MFLPGECTEVKERHVFGQFWQMSNNNNRHGIMLIKVGMRALMEVIYTITYKRYSFRYRIWYDGMLRNFGVNSMNIEQDKLATTFKW